MNYKERMQNNSKAEAALMEMKKLEKLKRKETKRYVIGRNTIVFANSEEKAADIKRAVERY